MLERIAEGRTDLVFDYVKKGHPPTSKTSDGSSLMQWCAYYGDASAIKFLLEKGETLGSLVALTQILQRIPRPNRGRLCATYVHEEKRVCIGQRRSQVRIRFSFC